MPPKIAKRSRARRDAVVPTPKRVRVECHVAEPRYAPEIGLADLDYRPSLSPVFNFQASRTPMTQAVPTPTMLPTYLAPKHEVVAPPPVASWYGTSSPRPEYDAAPQLFPAASSAGPCVVETSVPPRRPARAAMERPVVMPEKFSGRNEDFPLWLSQFRLTCDVNNWQDDTKLTMLALSLCGPALRAFSAIPEGQRRTFEAAAAALTNRFASADQVLIHQAALRSRTRRSGESLQELADDIRLLTGRAFPTIIDSDALDEIGLESFLAALDLPLRRKVHESEPRSLSAALRRAIVVDSFDDARSMPTASVGRAAVAQASCESEGGAQVFSAMLQTQERLLATQDKILSALGRLSLADPPTSRPRAAAAPPAAVRREPLRCFGCGEVGHFRSACPALRRPRPPVGRSFGPLSAGRQQYSAPPPSRHQSRHLN